jgi:uncharacterized protein YbcI
VSPIPGTAAHGDILTAISDGLDALLKEYYGRGPTEAKSYFQDDLVSACCGAASRGSSRRCWTRAAGRR